MSADGERTFGSRAELERHHAERRRKEALQVLGNEACGVSERFGGARVFPCGSEKQPTCRVAEGGYHLAVSGSAEIHKLFESALPSTVGIGVVMENGLFLLDVDCGDRKPDRVKAEAAKAWLKYHQPLLLETLTTPTASGSLHSFYNDPDGVVTRCLISKLHLGVDIIGGGKGYAFWHGLQCGSNGKPIVDAPAFLLDAIRKALAEIEEKERAEAEAIAAKGAASASKGNGAADHSIPEYRSEPYCRKVLDEETAKLAAMKSGRNAAIYAIAARLGELSKFGGFTEAEAREALYQACKKNNFIAEGGAKKFELGWRHGFDKGAASPVDFPPSDQKFSTRADNEAARRQHVEGDIPIEEPEPSAQRKPTDSKPDKQDIPDPQPQHKRHTKEPPMDDDTARAFYGRSAKELMTMKFEPVRWVVPLYLPEGVAVFAGRPKIGKSWLALRLAIDVASGHAVFREGDHIEQGEVLYLALEDNERRIHNRLETLLGDQPWPDTLRFRYDWKPIDNGGLDDMSHWLQAHSNARMVVADTLQKMKPSRRGRPEGDSFGDDYRNINPFQKLAQDFHVGILLVVHTRKADASDWVDTVSGTLGTTAAADTVLALQRARNKPNGRLTGTGRDLVEEVDDAVRFEGGLWRYVGPFDEAQATSDQQEILLFLRQNGPKTPNEVAQALGRERSIIHHMIDRMSRNGLVMKVSRGKYECIQPH